MAVDGSVSTARRVEGDVWLLKGHFGRFSSPLLLPSSSSSSLSSTTNFHLLLYIVESLL